MIHYHGAPIRSESMAAKFLIKRHAFISYAKPEQIGVIAESASTFAFDNGAFSFWRSGKKTDWGGYYDWVEKWYRRPGFDFALIPDVIAGDVEENQELIKAWPFKAGIGAPIWHLHEPIEWLIEIAKSYQRIAIGSSGDYSVIGSQLWWDRMCEVFNAITDDTGRPFCKVHGLRMLNPSIFTVFPFSSCDSTNVDRNCTDKARWKNYNPPNDDVRAVVIAERIEVYNSKPVWDRKYVQVDMFKKPEGIWL